MKKTKPFKLFAITFLASLTFIACGEDDNNNNPIAPSKGLRITQAGHHRYYYENNKFVGFSLGDDYNYCVTSTSPFVIEGKNTNEENVCQLSFNKNGYISSYKYSSSRVGTYSPIRTASGTLSYDEKGYLITVSMSEEWITNEKNGQSHNSFSCEELLTWTNGNLSKLVAKWEENYDGEMDNGTTVYELSYDNAVHNPHKQPSYILYEILYDLPKVVRALIFIDYVGMGSSYLPTRADITKEYDGEIYNDLIALSASLYDDGTIWYEQCQSMVWYYSYKGVLSRSLYEDIVSNHADYGDLSHRTCNPVKMRHDPKGGFVEE